MSLIHGLPWLAEPFEAMRATASLPLLAAGGFLFGAVHALLPGHGKLLLAGRHALAADGARSRWLPLVDGMTLAATRVFLAFALVAGSVSLADALGFPLPVRTLQIVAGVALVGIAIHLAWPVRWGTSHRALHRPNASRRPLDASLIVLALAPEPMALAITSFGVAEQNLRAAALVLGGLALGVGLTLGLAATFARTFRHREWLARVAPYAGPVLAVVLATTGAITVYDAWQHRG